MKFEITKEELNALENYKYLNINQLLSEDIENILPQESVLQFTQELIAEEIEQLKNIYEIMMKNLYNHFRRRMDFL